MIARSKYMDRSEIQRLRSATAAWSMADMAAGRRQGVVVWTVVDLLLIVACRANELAAVTVGDVDLKRGFIRIRRSKRRREVVDEVPITPELAAHLRQYMAWKRTVGESLAPDDRLLTGKAGVALTTSGVRKIFKAAVKRCGLPPELSSKSARHTMAVTLLAKTGNARLVQKHLGHARIETTMVYADIPFEQQRAALRGVYGSA